MSNIILHPGQSDVFKYLFPGGPTVRYAPVVASRGWGKSFFAATAATAAVAELLRMPADVPNKNVSIIAPTHSQAVDIYYPILAHVIGLEKKAIRSSQALGRFWFKNGVELRLWSYESIERMRGLGQYCVVADEVASWDGRPGLKDAWESIVLPTMVTRWPGNHKALIISTPKGYDYFYDMVNMQDQDDRWKSFHYTYKDSPYLDSSEINRVKLNTDPLKFAREYLASFEESGAGVFYMFKRKDHVRQDIEDFADDEIVHACIDFNVGIQATSIFALRGGQMQFISEMQGHPDTETLAARLRAAYPKHEIHGYPDPSGKARKTSAPVGVTDFTILESRGIKLRVKGQVPIVDSANAVNRQLKNAMGDINMIFHPRCVNTIKSIERTVWTESNPNLATIDKSEGVEHWGDGIRYATQYLFPIIRSVNTAVRGFGF